MMFTAWDGIFTDKQKREIINMCLHAKNERVELHEALKMELETKIRQPQKKVGVLPKNRIFDKPCTEVNCHGAMELYSVCCSDRAMKKQGYLTKWECNRCGKVEYSKQTLDDARKTLMGVKNGTSK